MWVLARLGRHGRLSCGLRVQMGGRDMGRMAMPRSWMTIEQCWGAAMSRAAWVTADLAGRQGEDGLCAAEAVGPCEPEDR